MRHVTALIGSLLAASASFAQDPVPGLQDLVGVKGASGETALEQRGYTWLRTAKSGGSAYTYYRENENGQCIAVRTADGRYPSIVYAPTADCDKEVAQAPSGRPGVGFETICGVVVGGETYSYRCKVEDHYEGDRRTRSILYFPDQTLKMVWQPENVVALHFEGMVPQTATYATSEGETNFVFEDKTCFFYSDPQMAAREVEHFQEQ